MEQTITNKRAGLNKRFHALINLNKLDAEEKKYIVRIVSDYTCKSTTELTDDQLQEAIKMLDNKRIGSLKKMRAKAINLARDLEYIVGEGKEINWTAMNAFCEKTFKMPFYKLPYDKLIDCITALENVIKHKAKKAVEALVN